MSLTDRIRIRLGAGPTTPRLWGDLDWGDSLWGYNLAVLNDFQCHVTRLTIDVGRQALLDPNPAGVASVEAVTVRPAWLMNTGPVLVIGARMLIEVRTDTGVWHPAWFGLVESAECDLEGVGVDGEPLVRWRFTVTDTLNRLGAVVFREGVHARPQERMDARVQACAALAVVGVTLDPAITDWDTMLTSTMARSMRDEMEAASEPLGRLVAARDRLAVFLVPLFQERSDRPAPVPVGPTLRLAAGSACDGDDLDDVDWAGHPWLLLPVPTGTTVSWPLSSVVNAVDAKSSGSEGWVSAEDAISIQDLGRRALVRSDFETTTPYYSVQAYVRAIRDRYSQPVARLGGLRFTYGRHLDQDSTVGPPGRPSDVAGFGLAFACLDVGQRIVVRLPPDDGDNVWAADALVTGFRWDITPDTADLDLFTDAALPVTNTPEPPLATKALVFAAGSWLAVTIPAAVASRDVQADMDLSGNPARSSYPFSSTPEDIAAEQASLDSSGGAWQLRIRSWTLNNTGVGTDRFQARWAVQQPILNRLTLQVFHPTAGNRLQPPISTPGQYDWAFHAGEPMRIGEGLTDGRVYGFTLKQASTGNVLVELRPEDFQPGGWTDRYGNVWTVVGTVNVVSV